MADQLSQRLASHWEGLRTDLLSGWISGKQIPPVRHETPFKPISLRDAHRMYIEVKGRENDLKFCQSVERSVKEHGLAITNVFNGTFIPEDNKRKERLPVPVDVIRRIQGECRSLNDEPRWLIALISDTGMRLSEACGLLSSDIVGGL